MGYVVLSKGQARIMCRALRWAEGLPTRVNEEWAVDQDPPRTDASGDPLPTPGWATEAVDAPLEAGDLVALEIPDHLERHLGSVVTVDGLAIALPTIDELVEVADLPPELQAALEARREKERYV